MNRILLQPEEIGETGLATLAGRRARHVIDVLKVALRDTVRVGLIDGPRGTGLVESVQVDEVVLQCAFDAEAPEPPRVDLLLAMPRPKVMKRLWAPLASLGVGRIVILNAAKTERNYFDTHWLDEQSYRPLLLEGLEQSGDTRVPRVSIERRFKPFIEDHLETAFPGGVRLAGHPAGSPARQVAVAPDARILLAIGPEGGWTDYELDLLDRHGFVRVGLGWRSLRSDTACIAFVALAGSLVAADSVAR
jgi:16S rRNA (uracil1498-N3)-methyltransferase